MLSDRGSVLDELGKALDARGEDARDVLRRAVADFTAALECGAERVVALNNRGLAYLDWGDACARSGTAAREMYGKAIADFDAALEQERMLAESVLRAALADAHYDLACIEALRSVGRAGPWWGVKT